MDVAWNTELTPGNGEDLGVERKHSWVGVRKGAKVGLGWIGRDLFYHILSTVSDCKAQHGSSQGCTGKIVGADLSDPTTGPIPFPKETSGDATGYTGYTVGTLHLVPPKGKRFGCPLAYHDTIVCSHGQFCSAI